jgi:hypothetical protein
MNQVAMTSFIKIGSGIPKLIKGAYTQIHTAWKLHKPISFFFKIRKVGLK